MLDAMEPAQAGKQAAPGAARPAPVRPPRPAQARPSLVETDVQAIMKGMEHARASSRTGYQEEVPSHTAPVHGVPAPDVAPEGTPPPAGKPVQ